MLAIRVLVAALRLLRIGLLRAMGLLLVRVPVWSWGLLNPVWHRICVRTFDGLLLSLLGLRRSIHALGLLRLRGPVGALGVLWLCGAIHPVGGLPLCGRSCSLGLLRLHCAPRLLSAFSLLITGRGGRLVFLSLRLNVIHSSWLFFLRLSRADRWVCVVWLPCIRVSIIAWQSAGTSLASLIVASSRRVLRSTPWLVRLRGILTASAGGSSPAIFLRLESRFGNLLRIFLFHPRFNLLPIGNALPTAFDLRIFDLRLDLPGGDLLRRFLNSRRGNDELLSVNSIEISPVAALTDSCRDI